LYDEDLLFFDRSPNDKRNFELSLRELEPGSGNPEVTTEEPITTTSSPSNGNVWSLENVVVIEANTSSSGRKKRDIFDPNVTFSSVQETVILQFIFDY
jgi:hypothetical protein